MRCGVTGLRPTFGFVPRTGAMALSWSMDKLGPITRSVEDAALVMQAIHGPDGKDATVREAAFDWFPLSEVKALRVGYIESAFAEPVLGTPDASAEKPETDAQRRQSAEQRQLARIRQGAFFGRLAKFLLCRFFGFVFLFLAHGSARGRGDEGAVKAGEGADPITADPRRRRYRVRLRPVE